MRVGWSDLPVRENVPETGSRPVNGSGKPTTRYQNLSIGKKCRHGRQTPETKLPVAWNFSEPGSNINTDGHPRKSHSDAFRVFSTLPFVRSVAEAPTSPSWVQPVARNDCSPGS